MTVVYCVNQIFTSKTTICTRTHIWHMSIVRMFMPTNANCYITVNWRSKKYVLESFPTVTSGYGASTTSWFVQNLRLGFRLGWTKPFIILIKPSWRSMMIQESDVLPIMPEWNLLWAIVERFAGHPLSRQNCYLQISRRLSHGYSYML